jgi:hypothetical protein
MDKVEKTFERFLDEEAKLDYPDFEAMWSRIESSMPGPDEKLQAVDMAVPKPKRLRKVAVISILAAVLVATPVVATLSYNWDSILSYRSGVRSALQEGLGQNIGKEVTHDGVTLTVHTAIVDDNRTVLLYSLRTKGGTMSYLNFAKMELKDNGGRIIEGRQSQLWDKASQTWNGYFETEWTPDTLQADVQFTAHNLQSFSAVERDIALDPLNGQTQTFTIGQDGMAEMTVSPFIQGEKMMMASAITFNQTEAKAWVFPHIGVYKDGEPVHDAGSGAFGKPGEHGEYTGQQFYHLIDLQEGSVKYKLLYTREEWRIDKDWTFNLGLDKQQMLSGTEKRPLNVPLEHPDGRMVLTQMIVTPTQIRIKASHEKYASFPFMNYELEVNGIVLKGGMWGPRDNPEETTFRFEVPVGLHVTEQTPVAFVAKYERTEHKDAKEPIRLKDISEEKKTMTTQVGGYTVKWTYYKQDGNLYVQSECEDPSFGGINQTYMRKGGENTSPGKKVSVSFGGDGNNQAIDMYPNFAETEAELGIFWYYTENPDKELRVEFNR